MLSLEEVHATKMVISFEKLDSTSNAVAESSSLVIVAT